mgnify:CR=1 FL=1
MTNWDFETDILVVGSGAGALTAALGAKEQNAEVMVIEKTELYGGTSAMSGGVVWLPASPMITEVGGEDSLEEARIYMTNVINEPHLEHRIDAYLQGSAKLTDFIAANTPIKLIPNAYYADMYPESPGAKWQYRAHEPDIFDGRTLGEELYRLRRQHPQTSMFGVIGWSADEATMMQTRARGWFKTAVTMVMRYLLDIPGRLRGTRDRRLVLGGSLVGGLRLAMLQRNMDIITECAAQEYILKDNRVIGIKVLHKGKLKTIRAHKGIILASGGFEKSQSMREKNLPGPTNINWTAGSPGNTGEMIERAIEIGADVEFMDEAWWGPTICIPGELQARMLIIEKNLPGSIIVNKNGERIVNEGSSYTKVVKNILRANTIDSESVPAYFIFDAKYRHRYPLGPMLPSEIMPDWILSSSIKQWVKKGDSLHELAEKLDIDGPGLEATVRNINHYAETGKDEEFHRGDSVYDQMYGDMSVEPNPCLGGLDKAPYYGVPIFPGDLGTKGGIKVNEFSQVQKASGEIIEGLYATGNCSAPLMGRTYPASGSTLGPAMVFGLIAARHALSG